MCQCQLLQKLREPGIPHRQQLAAGGVAYGTGQICLAVSRGSLENDVVVLCNEVAGGESQELGFVQTAVLVAFDILNSRTDP